MLIIIHLQHRFRKTRSIIIIDYFHPVINGYKAVHRRINRQISSLRMSHKPKRFPGLSCHILQIFHRLNLSWCLIQKTHIKIFFPANNCRIRSTVYYIRISITQLYCHRTELGLFIQADIIDIICKKDLSKTLCLCHLLHQKCCHAGTGHPRIDFFLGMYGKKSFRGFSKCYFFLSHCRNNPFKIHIDQFRQNQIIHLIKC